MPKKIGLVVLIVAATVISYIILTVMMPAITSIISLAGNASTQAGNYWGFNAAVSATPIWIYVIPAGISLLVIIMILRAPES